LRSFCDSYFAYDGAQNERCGTGTWFVKRRKQMAAPQKKAASVNSSRGTNDRNPHKGEFGGSSSPRPTVNPKVYAMILAFSDWRALTRKPFAKNLPKSGRANLGATWTFLAATPSPCTDSVSGPPIEHREVPPRFEPGSRYRYFSHRA